MQARVSIVASEFNEEITKKLCQGAQQTLIKRGLPEGNITTYWVPGALEIPLACKKIFSSSKKADGIIALGAIIRGETSHFDYVANGCASGVLNVSLEFSKPIIFGVLTTDTVEQSLNRAGLKMNNKGSEAAHSLLDLLRVFQKGGI